MATLLLSAAGMAIGGSVGGTVLGLSTAVAGRFVGATLGRVIDQRLMGAGSEVIESGQVDTLRLTGASEGAPLGQVFGRMRIGGQRRQRCVATVRDVKILQLFCVFGSRTLRRADHLYRAYLG